MFSPPSWPTMHVLKLTTCKFKANTKAFYRSKQRSLSLWDSVSTPQYERVRFTESLVKVTRVSLRPGFWVDVVTTPCCFLQKIVYASPIYRRLILRIWQDLKRISPTGVDSTRSVKRMNLLNRVADLDQQYTVLWLKEPPTPSCPQ